jgi:hypothetical protein
MIAPGGQKDHDSGEHEKMLADFFRNFDFGKGGRPVLRQNTSPIIWTPPSFIYHMTVTNRQKEG